MLFLGMSDLLSARTTSVPVDIKHQQRVSRYSRVVHPIYKRYSVVHDALEWVYVGLCR